MKNLKIKLSDLVDKFANRCAVCKHWKMDEYVLNNMLHKKREVLELKSGDFVIVNKYTKILTKPA